MKNITLFSQILQQIDRNIFHKAVAQYQTDKHSKGINSWTHLTAMLFCQISKVQSVREITDELLSVSCNLNHLGIQEKIPSRSSLSNINEYRDCPKDSSEENNSGVLLLVKRKSAKRGILGEKDVQENQTENLHARFYNNKSVFEGI